MLHYYSLSLPPSLPPPSLLQSTDDADTVTATSAIAKVLKVLTKPKKKASRVPISSSPRSSVAGSMTPRPSLAEGTPRPSLVEGTPRPSNAGRFLYCSSRRNPKAFHGWRLSKAVKCWKAFCGGRIHCWKQQSFPKALPGRRGKPLITWTSCHICIGISWNTRQKS